MKSGPSKFLLKVIVHDLKDLQKISKKTPTRSKSSSCAFNDTFLFPNETIDPSDFCHLSIICKVFHVNDLTTVATGGPLTPQLLGQQTFAIAAVYAKPQHFVFRQWVVLTKPDAPSEPTGFLRVSLGVFGPGDEVNIYKGEDFPTATHFLERAGGGIFGKSEPSFSVEVAFLGNAVETTRLRGTASPDWNEILRLPVMTPCFENLVVLRLWSQDMTGGSSLVGTTTLDWTSLMASPLSVRWENFYYDPDTLGKKTKGDGYLDTALSPFFFGSSEETPSSLESSYAGRLMISAYAQKISNPTQLVSPCSPSADPPTLEYLLWWDVYEIAEGATQEAKQGGMAVSNLVDTEVEVCLGPHSYRCGGGEVVPDAAAIVFDAKGGRLPVQRLFLPSRRDMGWDLVVYVVAGKKGGFTGGAAEKQRIFFARIPFSRLLSSQYLPSRISLTAVATSDRPAVSLAEDAPSLLCAFRCLPADPTDAEREKIQKSDKEREEAKRKENKDRKRPKRVNSKREKSVRIGGIEKRSQHKKHTTNPEWFGDPRWFDLANQSEILNSFRPRLLCKFELVKESSLHLYEISRHIKPSVRPCHLRLFLLGLRLKAPLGDPPSVLIETEGGMGEVWRREVKSFGGPENLPPPSKRETDALQLSKKAKMIPSVVVRQPDENGEEEEDEGDEEAPLPQKEKNMRTEGGGEDEEDGEDEEEEAGGEAEDDTDDKLKATGRYNILEDLSVSLELPRKVLFQRSLRISLISSRRKVLGRGQLLLTPFLPWVEATESDLWTSAFVWESPMDRRERETMERRCRDMLLTGEMGSPKGVSASARTSAGTVHGGLRGVTQSHAATTPILARLRAKDSAAFSLKLSRTPLARRQQQKGAGSPSSRSPAAWRTAAATPGGQPGQRGGRTPLLGGGHHGGRVFDPKTGLSRPFGSPKNKGAASPSSRDAGSLFLPIGATGRRVGDLVGSPPGGIRRGSVLLDGGDGEEDMGAEAEAVEDHLKDQNAPKVPVDRLQDANRRFEAAQMNFEWVLRERLEKERPEISESVEKTLDLSLLPYSSVNILGDPFKADEGGGHLGVLKFVCRVFAEAMDEEAQAVIATKAREHEEEFEDSLTELKEALRTSRKLVVRAYILASPGLLPNGGETKPAAYLWWVRAWGGKGG
uniref:C2 domain-containing protein n=1 Tax=Chromera velia CCMP2878 TaxID=1169474 RepID=A0A0G4I016_9ALVE|eukprot:Cvel_9824.t1-p1 / transcript=Cvel_9824.t1 / gene=Cvel_9824 / organism=Chromera_velia_CCMP2878 / gene_product=Myoferlin, putative / transcript_product=Myoferlin, putative / location=Cvel_scaffold577:19738-35756(-) / protein_length=1152 / sequence_SO=supercontig / SO=protein_coding / is_pseudo=false